MNDLATAKPRGVGIVAVITDMISQPQGASADEIVAALAAKYPDREPSRFTVLKQANLNCSSKTKEPQRGLVYRRV
jgi:hypothetical protein